MRSLRALALVPALTLGLGAANPARAQSMEDRFQDVFLSAGYCTAFGAALGTALLAFDTDPAQHLKKVAIGASLGFIGGSVLGSYVVFSPMFVASDAPKTSTLLASHQSLPRQGLVLRPTWSQEKHRFTSVEGGLTLLNF